MGNEKKWLLACWNGFATENDFEMTPRRPRRLY